MNSYILYKLTVGHPKTRLDFIKDVIDSLVSDYKETEAVGVARNQGIANLPFILIKTTQLLIAKGQGQYVKSMIKVPMHSLL